METYNYNEIVNIILLITKFNKRRISMASDQGIMVDVTFVPFDRRTCSLTATSSAT